MSIKVLNGLNMTGTPLTGLPNPSTGTEAATKDYVDAASRNVDWKDSVRAATLSNINLASPGATIDGVTMAAGESFFAGGQSLPAENGLYIWNGAATAATRRSDADSVSEVSPGLTFSIEEGTANANKQYRLITPKPITLGTTALTFTIVGSASAPYTGSDTVDITSNVVSVKKKTSGGVLSDTNGLYIDTSLYVRKYVQDIGNGSLTSITVTHNLGTLDVGVDMWESSTGASVWPDVSARTTSSVTLTFAIAPTTNQYRVKVNA